MEALMRQILRIVSLGVILTAVCAEAQAQKG
jgi:hypothetical protein